MSGTDVLVRPHFDADGDHFTVQHYQDVEDIIENNKALQAEPQRGAFRHVASIPNNIVVLWMNEEWERGNRVMPFTPAFEEVVQRKLRDPDWAYLRTDSQAVQGFMGFGS